MVQAPRLTERIALRPLIKYFSNILTGPTERPIRTTEGSFLSTRRQLMAVLFLYFTLWSYRISSSSNVKKSFLSATSQQDIHINESTGQTECLIWKYDENFCSLWFQLIPVLSVCFALNDHSGYFSRSMFKTPISTAVPAYKRIYRLWVSDLEIWRLVLPHLEDT